jgi:outer membrane protein
MLNRKILFIYLFVAANSLVFSQSVLTVEEAIKIGLEKNYAVLMVKNEQEIAKLQNNFGNAGISPTVSVNANLNLANINSYQEFSTGVIQERNGAQSNNTGASVNVGWVIFDGLKMFAVKKRLGLNEQLSAIELKQQMENTVYDIVSAYYTVVKTNEFIKAAKQNLSIYEERKKIAKLRLEIGSDSKVDVLLSQSNENKAKSAIIQLELQLLNAKTKLNTLLNKPVDTEFNTTDSIIVNFNPDIDDLKKEVSKSNSSILMSKQNELITQQSIKEARSANLPFVQLNGAYNFTRSQSQAGFVFLNRQAGLNAGVTAGWLLFNGNKNSKLVKERNILYLNQKYATEQMQQQIDGQVFNSYKTYLLNKTIVDLERQNLTDSKEVLDVSIERYKVGKSNLLETIETQKNLEDAQVRYIEALYAIKMAETDLLRANGSLVK